MDIEKLTLLEELKNDGITQPVLGAVDIVPREAFVEDELKQFAYLNRPLPIGHGQTISQPFIVAFMTQLLDIQKEDTVLEIGTGCGYQTAILSQLADHIYSVELVADLSKKAQATLKELGYKNIDFKIANGKEGWSEYAPYDKIIVTAAPIEIPQTLLCQLALGGRMVIPVGPENFQQLYLIEKKIDGQIMQTAIMPVKFVPLL